MSIVMYPTDETLVMLPVEPAKMSIQTPGCLGIPVPRMHQGIMPSSHVYMLMTP